MWNIEKIVSCGDYNYAIVRNHPNKTKNDYVLEHRIIVENHLNRLLDANEVVHHINGNKKDNRIENLQVLTKIEHATMHGRQRGHKLIILRCPCCGLVFERRYNQTHIAKKTGIATYCSRRCAGKYSRYIQLYGLTPKVELAISENIVSEYINYLDDNSEQTVLQRDA